MKVSNIEVLIRFMREREEVTPKVANVIHCSQTQTAYISGTLAEHSEWTEIVFSS